MPNKYLVKLTLHLIVNNIVQLLYFQTSHFPISCQNIEQITNFFFYLL